MEEHQKGMELERNQQYDFDGISFQVRSVFRENGERTLGAALLHLMQGEAEHVSFSDSSRVPT